MTFAVEITLIDHHQHIPPRRINVFKNLSNIQIIAFEINLRKDGFTMLHPRKTIFSGMWQTYYNSTQFGMKILSFLVILT